MLIQGMEIALLSAMEVELTVYLMPVEVKRIAWIRIRD